MSPLARGAMHQTILNYIASQRIGVLAVEMLDGSPHAATVHFAHASDPLVFYFETYREHRKAEPLFGRESSRASFVIGCDEQEMKTLQMDGVVRLVTKAKRPAFDGVYFAKFPDKKEKIDDPKMVFFQFIPSWWRFTDWKTPTGKVILSSEDSIAQDKN